MSLFPLGCIAGKDLGVMVDTRLSTRCVAEADGRELLLGMLKLWVFRHEENFCTLEGGAVL